MTVNPSSSDTSSPSPAPTRMVEVAREPLELFKILKFEGLADSGGAAKAAIDAGQVAVNGAVEQRKRRQIRSGDLIEYKDARLLICCPAQGSGAPEERS